MNTFGAIKGVLLDIGKTIKWKASENSIGPMEEFTKENIKMIKRMEEVYLNGIKTLKLFFCFENKYLKFAKIKILRSDGREYNGMWKNGKQHGEGLFFSKEENCSKKGIWNEGKRVRWISE